MYTLIPGGASKVLWTRSEMKSATNSRGDASKLDDVCSSTRLRAFDGSVRMVFKNGKYEEAVGIEPHTFAEARF